MGIIGAAREWPWVLRLAFGTFLVGFVMMFIAIATGSQERWLYAVAPAAFVLAGLLLALDVAGSAAAYASSTAKQRPLGVDYSGSMFAKPWFARVFGAGWCWSVAGCWGLPSRNRSEGEQHTPLRRSGAGPTP